MAQRKKKGLPKAGSPKNWLMDSPLQELAQIGKSEREIYP